MQKIVAFVVFCLLVFVLLVDFGLICVFVRLKSFRKKKINRLEIVPITSFTILLTSTPIKPPIENLFVRTCFYLLKSLFIHDNPWESLFCVWSFVRIFLNPSCLWKSLLFILICKKSLLIYAHLWESLLLSIF